MKVRNFACARCPFSASRKSGLDVHVASVHHEGEYGNGTIHNKCPECAYTNLRRCRLAKHMRKKHSPLLGGPPLPTFACHTCNYESDERALLKRHVREVHDRRQDFACQDCGFASARRSGLNSHRLAKHGQTAEPGVSFKRCDICDYRATRNRDLEKHRRSKHHGVLGTQEQKDDVAAEGDLRAAVGLKCEVCLFASSDMQQMIHHLLSKHSTMSEEQLNNITNM